MSARESQALVSSIETFWHTAESSPSTAHPQPPARWSLRRLAVSSGTGCAGRRRNVRNLCGHGRRVDVGGSTLIPCIPSSFDRALARRVPANTLRPKTARPQVRRRRGRGLVLLPHWPSARPAGAARVRLVTHRWALRLLGTRMGSGTARGDQRGSRGDDDTAFGRLICSAAEVQPTAEDKLLSFCCAI